MAEHNDALRAGRSERPADGQLGPAPLTAADKNGLPREMSGQPLYVGAWLPPKEEGGAWTPAPELMTAAEAARYLRLKGQQTDAALRRYRRLGLLKAVQIGRSVLYRRADLDEFVARLLPRSA